MDSIEAFLISLLDLYGVIGVMVIAFCIIIYRLIDLLVKVAVPKVVGGDMSFTKSFSRKRRKEAVFKVSKIITDLMTILDADGSAVFEYHNGGLNLSNLPFLHFSLTLLKNRLGVRELSKNFDNFFVSSVPEFINKLDNSDIYNIENLDEIKNTFPTLYKELKEDLVVHVLITNIIGVEEQIGFLVLGFRRHIVLNKSVRRVLNRKLQKISTLLDGRS